MRDRDKERQHHKRDEAIRNFTALLADLVRNSDLSWKEAKKQLKKDHRWDILEDLDRDERERIFNEHIHMLTKKKRDKFREMLEEITTMELTSSWKEIKKQIRDDPRYSKFGNSEKVLADVLTNFSLINIFIFFSANGSLGTTFGTRQQMPSQSLKIYCKNANLSRPKALTCIQRTTII